ncbi:MAG: choice-of-anchor Q domain-containing protein [Bdellovibrionales bacterium]
MSEDYQTTIKIPSGTINLLDNSVLITSPTKLEAISGSVTLDADSDGTPLEYLVSVVGPNQPDLIEVELVGINLINGRNEANISAMGAVGLRSDLANITMSSVEIRDNVMVVGGSVSSGNGIGIGITNASTVVLEEVTIDNNNHSGANSIDSISGGGAYISSGAIDIKDITVTNNSAWYRGGGLFLVATEDILIDGALFDGNSTGWSSSGGGAFTIYQNDSSKTTNIKNVQVSNNSGGSSVIQLISVNNTFENSAIFGNTSSRGIQLSLGSPMNLVFLNASIYDQIYVSDDVNIEMTHSLLYNASIFQASGLTDLTLKNSMLVSSDGANCFAFGLGSFNSVTSEGYNIVTDSTGDCGTISGTGDLVGTDPNLVGTLPTDVGSSIFVQALNTGSIALDRIPASQCTDLPTDAIGGSRPNEGESFCDVGPYEAP